MRTIQVDVKKYNRKPFVVEAVQVFTANMDELAEWCSGSVETTKTPTFLKELVKTSTVKFVHVPVKNTTDERQTRAFSTDWIVKQGDSFKVYPCKAFLRTFELDG